MGRAETQITDIDSPGGHSAVSIRTNRLFEHTNDMAVSLVYHVIRRNTTIQRRARSRNYCFFSSSSTVFLTPLTKASTASLPPRGTLPCLMFPPFSI